MLFLNYVLNFKWFYLLNYLPRISYIVTDRFIGTGLLYKLMFDPFATLSWVDFQRQRLKDRLQK